MTTWQRPIGTLPAAGWFAAFVTGLFVLPGLLGQLTAGAGVPWLPLAATVALTIAAFLAWPVRTLFVFAIFILFIDTIRLSAGDQIKLVDELVVPAMAAITLVRRRSTIRSRIVLLREASVVVFVAAGLLSSFVNGVPPQIWLPGMALAAKAFGVFYITLVHDVTTAELGWAARVGFVVGLLVLTFGALELVAPTVFLWIGLEPSIARAGLPAIKSVFYHPQLFGWLCGVVALYLFAHYAVLGRRWMVVVGLVFSLGTILSARRRAMAALVAGLVAGATVDTIADRPAFRRRVLRWLPSTVGLAVMFVAFLPALAGLYQLTIERYVVPSVPSTGGPSIPSEGEDAPARIALYQGSVRIAADNFPLGAGLGKFGSWMSRAQYSDVYREYGLDDVHGLSPRNPQFITDTFWPQVLGEAGVVGLVGYIGFVFVVGVQLWRLGRRRDLPPPVIAMVLAAGMVFVQTLVESLASAIFSSPPQIYLVMLAIAGVFSWAAANQTPDAGPAGAG